jgi:hypothetical protein
MTALLHLLTSNSSTALHRLVLNDMLWFSGMMQALHWHFSSALQHCTLAAHFSTALGQLNSALHFSTALQQSISAKHFTTALQQSTSALHYGSALQQSTSALQPWRTTLQPAGLPSDRCT